MVIIQGAWPGSFLIPPFTFVSSKPEAMGSNHRTAKKFQIKRILSKLIEKYVSWNQTVIFNSKQYLTSFHCYHLSLVSCWLPSLSHWSWMGYLTNFPVYPSTISSHPICCCPLRFVKSFFLPSLTGFVKNRTRRHWAQETGKADW